MTLIKSHKNTKMIDEIKNTLLKNPDNLVLIICGPTASGKTDFAHHLGIKYRGEIVNCDSMQIYKNIPIITASPSTILKSELAYHLYNFLNIEEEFSVIKYTQLAANIVKEINARGNLPIIVGGTGMYINALLFGYNEVPLISKEISQTSAEIQLKLGQQEFYNLLKTVDPLAASKLNINDKQRTLRAYEVFKQTGQSIFHFQASQKLLLLPEYNFLLIFLNPARQFLYKICNERLIQIFHAGAIDEVRSIKEKFPYLKTSATKAIGLQEIKNYLNNHITLEEALTLSQTKTRQYAKRQITWFKNQLKDKYTFEYSSLEEFTALKKKF